MSVDDTQIQTNYYYHNYNNYDAPNFGRFLPSKILGVRLPPPKKICIQIFKTA